MLSPRQNSRQKRRTSQKIRSQGRPLSIRFRSRPSEQQLRGRLDQLDRRRPAPPVGNVTPAQTGPARGNDPHYAGSRSTFPRLGRAGVSAGMGGIVLRHERSSPPSPAQATLYFHSIPHRTGFCQRSRTGTRIRRAEIAGRDGERCKGRAGRGGPRAGAEPVRRCKKSGSPSGLPLCVGATYLPGPLPAKYCQQRRA